MSQNEDKKIPASADNKLDRPEYAWCRRFFDELDFSEIPVKNAEKINIAFNGMLDDTPEWVGKVNREMVLQSMPVMRIPKWGKGKSPPEVLGLSLGQICANLYALCSIGRELSKEENIKASEAKRKFFEEHPELPSVQSELMVANSFPPILQHLVTVVLPRFGKGVEDAFKAALAQKEYSQAVDFFQGFAKGISKPGISSGRKLAGSTTATPIYEKLMVHREQVQKLPNYPALREFLISGGLPENVVGSVRRLQKICERIGLHLGKRGRPPG